MADLILVGIISAPLVPVVNRVPHAVDLHECFGTAWKTGKGLVMGSILPVGDGSARPIVPPSVRDSSQTRNPADTNQVSSSVTSTTSSSSISVSQIQSSAAQMMDTFGGSSMNSQAMQLLVALMILLALLESTQQGGGGGGGQSGLSRLGAGGSDRSQYIGIFSSSSTVSYEQMVTPPTSQSSDSVGQAGETQKPGGNQLDVSA